MMKTLKIWGHRLQPTSSMRKDWFKRHSLISYVVMSFNIRKSFLRGIFRLDDWQVKSSLRKCSFSNRSLYPFLFLFTQTNIQLFWSFFNAFKQITNHPHYISLNVFFVIKKFLIAEMAFRNKLTTLLSSWRNKNIKLFYDRHPFR